VFSSCIELSIFDYDKYVKACNELSTFWCVWKPSPDSDVLRYDRYITGKLSKKNRMALASLYAWANRTDPGSILRYAAMRRGYLDSLPCKKDPYGNTLQSVAI
jgi:hypothetical protein